MKRKIYLRVTKNGHVAASTSPKIEPMHTPSYKARIGRKYHPTVFFSIIVDIPETAFTKAEQAIAEIELKLDQLGISTSVAELEPKPPAQLE